MQNHPIISQIQQSNKLPQMPKVFGEALNMLLEPCEIKMEECLDKLSGIPKLEATLVKVLNYTSKLNRDILTLKDAVLYLGAKSTRMIAISYITRLLLSNKSGQTKKFNNKTYWRHCIATSIAGYMIAGKTGLCDRDKIFTYGLIHDIGVTVLATIYYNKAKVEYMISVFMEKTGGVFSEEEARKNFNEKMDRITTSVKRLDALYNKIKVYKTK